MVEARGAQRLPMVKKEKRRNSLVVTTMKTKKERSSEGESGGWLRTKEEKGVLGKIMVVFTFLLSG